ncbi:NAD-dependent epimerase/dehydratase family protein [Lactococcus lactis]|uniref:NAD-dependent epimerase/dehydratase family protein n=1 Tax=Lactococcus lactis TaxID=1358 RepID=UPI001F5384CE|nr:NAD-dependent epimerase/dehydratase family protein [Lactococcus lactis]MCI1071758.1 NAD-dependent epimerase/dehydratase family protein [Lactococcus lactis]
MITFENKIVQEDLKKIVSSSYINFEKLRGKTVLITGVSGMLATYLAYVIYYLDVHKNFQTKIIGTARNMEKANAKFQSLSKEYFELVQHDVTQPFDYEKDIDYIIHAASNASPKFISTDPVGIIKANTLGTMNLLELARTKRIQNFLFLSTREIYGKSIKNLLTEQDYGGFDILSPRACYPESKRMAETLLESYSVQYEIPYTVTRIAHSYGPGMEINNDGRIMSDLISNVVNHEDIILKSEGTAERAFCYISDATTALLTVLLNGDSGQAYNVANEDEPIQIRDLAQKLVSLLPDEKLKVKFDIPTSQSTAYSTDGRTVMDMSKIEKLGWNRLVDLDSGLKKTIESFE